MAAETWAKERIFKKSSSTYHYTADRFVAMENNIFAESAQVHNASQIDLIEEEELQNIAQQVADDIDIDIMNGEFDMEDYQAYDEEPDSTIFDR